MRLKTDRQISSSRAKDHRGSSEGSEEEVWWGLHVRKTLWLTCGEGPRWRGHIRRLLEARRAMAMGLARKEQLRTLKKPREEKFQGGRTVNSVQWCREQMFIGCSDKSILKWVVHKAGRRVAREEWKGNTVSAVSELSPFLLLLVMISSSTSNLGERKRHLLGN